MSKIQNGQFFTEFNVFEGNLVFQNFMNDNNLWNKKILEPFAGKNNLIKFLQDSKHDLDFSSFDIEPQDVNVKKNDSINNWNYKNFDLVVTNPPYLSKSSSKRMKLSVDFQNYDDLYKLSLDRCLRNVRFTIAIIPTTLINSNRKNDQFLIKKLFAFQLLPNKNNFEDTEHPVALAYFDNKKNDDNFLLYENNNLISDIKSLKNSLKNILKTQNNLKVYFNYIDGNLCVNTSDNTINKNNIRFFDKNWKQNTKIKPTDRHKVKMLVEDFSVDDFFIEKLNKKIKELRNSNCDYLWSPFKGVSKQNQFRRRLDFKTIKMIINSIDL